MKKRISIFIIVLVFIVTAVIFCLPIKQALVFEYEDSETMLAYMPFVKQKRFKIKYMHSIHLSDVVESYKITRDGYIQQYELMYEDFAIGMPENAAKGERFEQKDGKYYLKNMDRKFLSFDLRLGKVRANHTVIYHNKEYPLSKYIEPGTWIRIKAKKINLLQELKGVNIIEQP